MGAYQVGTADGDPGAVRDGDPAHLDAVLGTAAHDVGGDHAVGDDAGIAIDVFQKPVQSSDALREARFEQPPVGPRDDAGHAVDGDDAFVGLVVAVDGEGDAFVRERARDPFLHTAQLVVGHPPQGVVQGTAVLAGRTVVQEHLIVERSIEIVVVEVHLRGPWRTGVGTGSRREAGCSRRPNGAHAL